MKILTPIDGSEYSDNSLAFLASRTTLLGVTPNITLFTVDTSVNSGDSVPYDETNASPRVKAAFERARQYFGEDYDKLEKVVGFGDPAKAIVAEADRIDAKIIIQGTRGQGVIKGLLFGSVTQKIFALTTRPVLVLRGQKALPQKIMHVGVAVDGTAFGPEMMKQILAMLGSYKEFVNFDLLNVAEIPDLPQHRRVTVEEIKALTSRVYDENTASVRALLDESGIRYTRGILSGSNPGDAVAQYAKDHHLDLIVMGSHGYSPIKSILFGSNSMRVASQGNVPMLIFHPSEYPD